MSRRTGPAAQILSVQVVEDEVVDLLGSDAEPGEVRWHRNAVDGPMAAELAHAFHAFDADPAADAAVLWGAGGHFCAGADAKGVNTDR